MDINAIASVAGGVIVPVIVGMIKRQVTSPQLRWLIAVAFSAVTGFVVVLTGGAAFTWQNLSGFSALAFAASQAAWGTWRGLADPIARSK